MTDAATISRRTIASECGLAVIEAMAGTRTAIDDPFLPRYADAGYADLQAHQAAAIDAVAGALALTRRAR